MICIRFTGLCRNNISLQPYIHECYQLYSKQPIKVFIKGTCTKKLLDQNKIKNYRSVKGK